MVVVSDYNMIKDLYKKLEACARPKISQPFHELRFGSSDGLQRGLLQSSGSEWMEQRRFTMRQLKDMGFGKSSMEDLIIREIEDLCALLRKVNTRAFIFNSYGFILFIFGMKIQIELFSHVYRMKIFSVSQL